MKRINKREEREFVGASPKNKSIASRIRDHGYLGVMFNKDEFMDAVVWAANVVYEYKDFFSSNRDGRIVISIDELPFIKFDVTQAHFIMLIYYSMKQNYVLLEQFKQSLYTVARFQKIADADIEMIKKVNERLSKTLPANEDDFSFSANQQLKFAEKEYNYYSGLVTEEIEKYRDECLKLKL
ncbi:MAG: hypothetical protein LBK91_06795 [Synergistaceae bacterium]|jgi:hypothetical protein|nr:hypothetical protein [Synergistaceae bacterium]